MQGKRRKRVKKWRNKLANMMEHSFMQIGAALLAGILAFLAVLLLFALLMTRADLSDQTIAWGASLALGAGAWTGAFFQTRKKRRQGFITGLLWGLFFFGCAFLFSGLSGGPPGAAFFQKLIFSLICGGIGGVMGVNTRPYRLSRIR